MEEPAGLQDAPDFGEAAADIAHRTVKDDVPRQNIVETLVGEGQRVGMGLAQAQSKAARGRLAASEVEAGRGTVDRLDGKAVLGEEQCVPADTATEVQHMLRAPRLQHRHQPCHRRVRHQPVGATLRRCPPLVPRLNRRRRHPALYRINCGRDYNMPRDRRKFAGNDV